MGCILEVALPLVKTRESDENVGLDGLIRIENGLIPAGVQMRSAWLVNDGCNFVRLPRRGDLEESVLIF